MADWKPIETAPKDGQSILLFGLQEPHSDLRCSEPIVFTGYWDDIDSAWCGTASTWTGPFYRPSHWQPLPEAPG